MLWRRSAKPGHSSQLCRPSRLLPVAGRGDGSAKLWQHTAAYHLKTCPLVAIMKAGNCYQFALIKADQRCIDHVFDRHDDRRGLLLPWEAGDFPTVGAVLPGNTAWTRIPLLVSSCCSERLKARTYALDAPYTPLSASTEMPAAEPMLMIVPVPRLTKAGGEASEGGDIEGNHVLHFPDVGLKQRGDGSEAGVIDEHGDARIVLQLCFHFREIRLVVEVPTMEVIYRPLALERPAASVLSGSSLRATRMRSCPRFARRSA